MKAAASAVILALCAAGCATDHRPLPQKAQPAAFAEIHPYAGVNRHVAVALPRKTKYDGNPVAKRYYLEWYRAGYRTGLSGVSATCCLVECPYRKARIDGWYDGQRRGLLKTLNGGPIKE